MGRAIRRLGDRMIWGFVAGELEDGRTSGTDVLLLRPGRMYYLDVAAFDLNATFGDGLHGFGIQSTF